MDLLEPKFLYVGDHNTYSSTWNTDFELFGVGCGLPSIVYIDTESDESEIIEVGRCYIGFEWGTPWLYISGFEIAKPYRGQGYARDFFDEIKRFAKSRGFSYLWLNPREDRNGDSPVRDFWVHLGGVPVTDVCTTRFVPRMLVDSHHRESLVFDLTIGQPTEAPLGGTV